ncbi:MAG TPA: alpha/beta hydrolase [Burkholderiales bacterium]|nr:alpha/beta hydrolase [Burkholderiales bacterium]
MAALVLAGFAAFKLSPWPSALAIRAAFDKDATTASQALAKHVPPGVSSRLNERYDADPDARLDVFYPSELENGERALTTVVWVHGGGWISGSKNQIANYLKILAGKGYTVVGVDYSVAPGKTYPTPLRQVNAALAYLQREAKRLHVDASRFVLAGDSGGAHIAAQVANLVSAPAYAAALGIAPSIGRPQLRGTILYCGGYDFGKINLDGAFGEFMRTVLWSYFGRKDYAAHPLYATASVIGFLTPDFPPAFISVGNADPLAPQSRALAETLAARGVRVDTLFFSDDTAPALAHEYQFNLDSASGRLALERSLKFLAER